MCDLLSHHDGADMPTCAKALVVTCCTGQAAAPEMVVYAAQVCDFNLSRALKFDTVEPSRAALNSPAWSAPERLQGKRYGKAADVFSFGVILWELITLGQPPLPRLHHHLLLSLGGTYWQLATGN